MSMNNKKVWIVVAGVLAVTAIVVALVFYTLGSITSPIKNQLAALKVGDYTKAYSYTSKDFKSATTLSDFQDFANHYPSIKDNAKAVFTEREITGDSGVVRGTLYSADGAAMPVEYLLVKESGDWKILGVQVNPAGVRVTDQASTVTESDELVQQYDNKESRYTIKYPASWEFEKANDGTIIFSGKRGTQAYYATVNIQTVLTKKTGGDFTTVKEFMADIRKQAISQSPGVKFLESGSVDVVDATIKNGGKDHGLYAVFTYQYKGKEFKQWQIVVLRNDGQVFYAWAYTSPAEVYPAYVGVAKSMLDSWEIY